MNYKNTLAYISENAEQTIIEVASTTVTYLGFSEKGTATSAAKWTIVKITQASATAPEGLITIKWARQIGDDRSSVWDDRASLTYVS